MNFTVKKKSADDCINHDEEITFEAIFNPRQAYLPLSHLPPRSK